MANPTLESWAYLCKLCSGVGLPQPVMQPGGLKDTICVEIPGHTKRMSRGEKSAIEDCILWAQGYRAGFEACDEIWRQQ